ncbi:MAG: helix-turn-helix domain-containing protein, partial [Polymorphobacter sp.]
MTKRPARTRLAPEDRRVQLVVHAIACFADHGIARATQAQVAERAGVSVSAVYSYFRTRADLVDAVLETVAVMIVA